MYKQISNDVQDPLIHFIANGLKTHPIHTFMMCNACSLTSNTATWLVIRGENGWEKKSE